MFSAIFSKIYYTHMTSLEGLVLMFFNGLIRGAICCSMSHLMTVQKVRCHPPQDCKVMLEGIC